MNIWEFFLFMIFRDCFNGQDFKALIWFGFFDHVLYTILYLTDFHTIDKMNFDWAQAFRLNLKLSSWKHVITTAINCLFTAISESIAQYSNESWQFDQNQLETVRLRHRVFYMEVQSGNPLLGVKPGICVAFFGRGCWIFKYINAAWGVNDRLIFT